MMQQEYKAKKYDQKIKVKVYELMERLKNTSLFIDYYYKILPTCASRRSAFDIVNVLHFLLFDEYRYSSYDSFRKSKNKLIKTKNGNLKKI